MSIDWSPNHLNRSSILSKNEKSFFDIYNRDYYLKKDEINNKEKDLKMIPKNLQTFQSD